MKKRFLCGMLAAILCATAAMGGATAFASEDLQTPRVINYDDIEGIVEESGMGNADMSGMLKALEQSLGELGALQKSLQDQIAALPPGSPSIPLLQSQLAQVTANYLNTSMTYSSFKNTASQLTSAHDQLVIGGKTLYITYNTLSDQVSELRRSKSVFEVSLAAAQKQYELGMITELALENTKNAGKAIDTGIDTMNFQLTNLKRSFNNMIGRNYNGQLTIRGIPYTKMLTKLDDIKYSDDLEKAQDHTDSANLTSNSEIDSDKDSFSASFRKLYETVNLKKTALESEERSLALEEKNFAASQLQYDLGMLSKLGLTNAQDKLDTQKAKVRTAQTDLFTAYEQYQWAIDYGIISGK